MARDTSLTDAFTDSDLPSGSSLRAVASDAASLALADLTSLSGIAETEARPEGAELVKGTIPANTETVASTVEAAAHGSSASCCPGKLPSTGPVVDLVQGLQRVSERQSESSA